MSDFNVLKFVADNAGLNIFKALEKAYEQGKADAAPTWDWLMNKADEWGMAYGKQFLIEAQRAWEGE